LALIVTIRDMYSRHKIIDPLPWNTASEPIRVHTIRALMSPNDLCQNSQNFLRQNCKIFVTFALLL